METAIATWGNSEAVRIPQAKLKQAGLKHGDSVRLELNSSGRLEIIPLKQRHRHTHIAQRLTFDKLFAGYEGGQLDNSKAWPNDELIGAEQKAWQP
ncbi:MAG: AbrB/MazE/SpoVT family DNA-binding domain-containing protein [Coriobacteriales bacterium]|nr:AbrB/MazE/SpoVT family DNA-binding domain-containing protein [Coriobacteriales bacterium]